MDGVFTQPAFVIGAVFAFAGALLFMGLVFSSGGVAKSKQFQVIKELFAGVHGNGRRLLAAGALLALLVGTCLLFSGVAASDHDRAERCRTRCAAEGYAGSRIGPNTDRTEDRSTWWVACICEEAGREPMELRAE